MSRVLIVCHDVVGHRMAGPAIRAWEFACCLSEGNQVTLAIPNETSLTGEDFALVADTDQMKLDIKELDPSDKYEFYVLGIKENQPGPPSETLIVRAG